MNNKIGINVSTSDIFFGYMTIEPLTVNRIVAVLNGYLMYECSQAFC